MEKQIKLEDKFLLCCRGKTFQARVLKRMVKVGYLDIETALSVVKQCLHLRHDRRERADGLLYLFPLTMEVSEIFMCYQPLLITMSPIAHHPQGHKE